MGQAWTEFLRGGHPCDHAVQVYAEAEELAGSVASYLAAGFAVGEPAVVVATDEHWALFAEGLAQLGWDAGSLEREGLLALADAEATLASFMVGDGPAGGLFEQVVGGLLDRVQAQFPDRTIRAFGEMVDLLCERGQLAGAVALEELWNGLARSRRFALLCGYRLDVFDRSSQTGALPHVCRVHSHVLPALDTTRLSSAVDRALEEVLGHDEAGKVYVLVGVQAREERVPIAQLVLMWVSEN
ncbi:MAG: hypothetical protein QOF27_1777, partial [Gaiellaceae bacterium]|nr:hypothetical protein [Gaiellaceae bacterium]